MMLITNRDMSEKVLVEAQSKHLPEDSRHTNGQSLIHAGELLCAWKRGSEVGLSLWTTRMDQNKLNVGLASGLRRFGDQHFSEYGAIIYSG